MRPLGRIGRSGEAAEVLRWLLESSCAWVTGTVVGVDGGMARVRPGG